MRPRSLLAVLAPLFVIAALAAPAHADMCLGGGNPPPDPIPLPDAGSGSAGDGGAAVPDAMVQRPARPGLLGGGFLFAAVVASGWLTLRRRRGDQA